LLFLRFLYEDFNCFSYLLSPVYTPSLEKRGRLAFPTPHGGFCDLSPLSCPLSLPPSFFFSSGKSSFFACLFPSFPPTLPAFPRLVRGGPFCLFFAELFLGRPRALTIQTFLPVSLFFGVCNFLSFRFFPLVLPAHVVLIVFQARTRFAGPPIALFPEKPFCLPPLISCTCFLSPRFSGNFPLPTLTPFFPTKTSSPPFFFVDYLPQPPRLIC